MKLLIGADLVPTESSVDLFNKADMAALIGDDLVSLLKDQDIRIFNLEAPITDKTEPIPKCGSNLAVPTSALRGIMALNPSLLSLANNHILDQGAQGLASTDKILSEKGIPYIGIGNNVHEASKPYIFEKDDLKIGVYAVTEHEFTIATENSPGANPFDPLESLYHISSLKKHCDYVVVLYHGGREHYRYPSPYCQKVCRAMARHGANLVVCQHNHCVSCFEEYDGATIVYGQGNFLFDGDDLESWKTSVLIEVILDRGAHFSYIPIVRSGNGVRLATDQEAEDILSGFFTRSLEITQPEIVQQKYQQHAAENISFYLRVFSGCNRWLTRIDRILLKGAFIKRRYKQKKLLAIQNYIECEAHRELVLTGLRSMMTDNSANNTGVIQ